jgi:hypothetical protein
MVRKKGTHHSAANPKKIKIEIEGTDLQTQNPSNCLRATQTHLPTGTRNPNLKGAQTITSTNQP